MKSFDEIVNSRRSVRKFDESHDFDSKAVERSLRLALLSPNSSNLQTWEFYRVKSKDKLEELSQACLGQGAARTASELVVFVSRPDLWKKRSDWNVAQIKTTIKDPNNLSKAEKRALGYYQKIIPFFYNHRPWLIKPIIRRAITLWRTLNGQAMMRLNAKSDVKVVCNKSTGLAAQTFMLAMNNEGYETCPMEGFDYKWVKNAINLPKSAEITMIIACGKGLPEGTYGKRLRIPYEEVVFEI